MFCDLTALTPYQWQTYLILAIGMISTGTTLHLGRALFRGRRSFMPKEFPTCSRPPIRDPFEWGSATERRRSLRRTGSPLKVVLDRGCRKGEALDGWVLDRSVGGLGLYLPFAAPQGAILRVHPALAQGPAPMSVEVQVRHCRPHEQGFFTGCRFVQSLPWNQLLMFG
jgi:hypothetical protein